MSSTCLVCVAASSALRLGDASQDNVQRNNGSVDREVRDELFMFHVPLSADFSGQTTTPGATVGGPGDASLAEKVVGDAAGKAEQNNPAGGVPSSATPAAATGTAAATAGPAAAAAAFPGSKLHEEAIKKASSELKLKMAELVEAKDVAEQWSKDEQTAFKFEIAAEKEAISDQDAEMRAEKLGEQAAINEARAKIMVSKSDDIADAAKFQAARKKVEHEAAKHVLSSEPTGTAKEVVEKLAATAATERAVADKAAISAGEDAKKAESIQSVSHDTVQAAAAASDFKKAVSMGMQKLAADKSVEGAADAAAKKRAMENVEKKKAEVDAAMRMAFKAMDSNGDGKIDFNEFLEAEKRDVDFA